MLLMFRLTRKGQGLCSSSGLVSSTIFYLFALLYTLAVSVMTLQPEPCHVASTKEDDINHHEASKESKTKHKRGIFVAETSP